MAKEKMNRVVLFFQDKNYREFVRLFLKYRKIERNKEKQIRFLNYHIKVVDCLSFIFQFKEIFFKRYYDFKTDSEFPLILDCGANIGISAIYFKKQYPKAKIKAFEADPNIAKVLDDNLRNNSINDVDIIPKAIWIDDDGVDFGAEGADSGSILSDKNKITIPSIRLKDILEKEPKVDFLKMDIEGAEVAVVEDCKNSLTNVKNIFIEYHSFYQKEQELDKILQILTVNGFRYFIETAGHRKSPLINQKSKINDAMDLQVNVFGFR